MAEAVTTRGTDAHELTEVATEAELQGRSGRLLVQMGGRNVVRTQEHSTRTHIRARSSLAYRMPAVFSFTIYTFRLQIFPWRELACTSPGAGIVTALFFQFSP